MKTVANAVALAMAVSPAAAVYKGFNYGSTNDDGSYRNQADFESQFETAAALVGTDGFTSARLYTMVQGGTTNNPISAIPAAIAKNTTLLLGLWCSGDTFNDEIAALTSAISTYGDQLSGVVIGISVGSEDLYRNSVAGAKAHAGIGKNPSTIVDDINTVRSTISGTVLDGVPIGHVDTWTAWANSSNDAVINAVDWVGLDAYPYFQDTDVNTIANGSYLFQAAVEQVNAVAGGKDIWVTETGWPVSGKTYNLAVANTDNAETYWDQVGCELLFGQYNTWWYILQDAGSSPSFGVVGSDLTTTPLYNLTCPAVTSTIGSASASATATGSSTGTSTPSTITSTPTPGVSTSNGTTTPGASGTASKTGASSTGSSSSTPYTGGASSVSASAAGIVAAIFALVVAF